MNSYPDHGAGLTRDNQSRDSQSRDSQTREGHQPIGGQSRNGLTRESSDFGRSTNAMSGGTTSGSTASGSSSGGSDREPSGLMEQAREATSEGAAAVGTQMKAMLDQQVGAGCSLVGRFAKSAKHAADDLKNDAPQLASLVVSAASRLEGLAKNIEGQSADQLMKSAADYTRRQPALVFGIAALAGFVALRVIKSASAGSSDAAQRARSHVA